jgi:hypothetical protein
VIAAGTRPRFLLGHLAALLELRPDDLLVQLGCAFPDQLLALAALVPLRYQPLVVDPSPERLAPLASTPQLRLVAMNPLRFAAFPMQCDRILLEESLLQDERGAELARGLFTRLQPSGRLLAIGTARPPERDRSLAAPRRRSDRCVARTLEGAGFEVRHDAAELRSGSVDLFLGVKPS